MDWKENIKKVKKNIINIFKKILEMTKTWENWKIEQKDDLDKNKKNEKE